jgi:hypothetical protein
MQPLPRRIKSEYKTMTAESPTSRSQQIWVALHDERARVGSPEESGDLQQPRHQPSKPAPGATFNPFGWFRGIWVPEPVLRYAGLSPGAKLCYGRLLRFAGKRGYCWPSTETLASELGVSLSQAKRYLAELKGDRFITVEHRRGLLTNIYRFLWHRSFESAPARQDHTEASFRAGVEYDPPQGSDVAHKDSLGSGSCGSVDSNEKRSKLINDPSGSSKVKHLESPLTSETEVARLLKETGQRFPESLLAQRAPDWAIVLRVARALQGTPVSEFARFLDGKFEAGYSPCHALGPHKWPWFETVAKEFADVYSGRLERRQQVIARSLQPCRKCNGTSFFFIGEWPICEGCCGPSKDPRRFPRFQIGPRFRRR